MAEAHGKRGTAPSSARARIGRWRVAALAAAAVVVWALLGVRAIEPDRFGVLDSPLGVAGARRVDGRWAVAPPGLLRLTTYPRGGIELPLPEAEQAMLRGADGSRFGFRGWITVRPLHDAWRTLHRAASGRGVEGALLDGIRETAAELRPGFERSPDRLGLEREMTTRLGAALATRGLELRRLELEAVDFLAVRDPATSVPTDARLLVVGLDGLDWEILDPLLEQGRLPNLKRLIEQGARAKLLSISPMLSPVVWTTVATGVEPSRHGILDFLVEGPDGQDRQPVTSAQRRVPSVWEMLSRSGVEVGVTGWWASWPADPVRGYLVSDRIAYQLFGFRADPDDARGKTWPPELYERIRSAIVSPESVSWDEVRPYLSGSRSAASEFDPGERELLDGLRTLLASGRSYLGIGQHLRREFRPQLEVIYFEGTDTVGHLFMPYRPPALPGIPAARIDSFSAVVDRYYETVDGYLGELLADRGADWTVMVLSDHGFASDATRPRTTDSRIGHGAAADWHRRFGALVLSGARVRPGRRIEEASVYDIAPTILALFGQPIPRSWPGRVLAAALDDDWLDAHPVRYRLDEPVRDELVARGLVDPAAADLLEKLQSLGYVATGEDEAESITARNNAGVALLAEGRYGDAEREFRAGLAARPDARMLRVNLGLALRFQGRQDEAAEQFAAALESPATLRMAGHMLAQIRLERGELAEAERLLRRVLEREPGAADVRNTLGQLLERKGEGAAAEQEYLRAAELDPDAALPRNNLGSLARRRGDLAGAESWYQRAIEADPYFMGAYNNLALVYQDMGQLERARDLYDRALAKAPDNADVLNNLGSWHYAAGDFDEAGRYWRRAAAADPTDPSPRNNLAGLEIHAQRYTEAERLLRGALELDPDYGDARINLALIYGIHGRVEDARAELERATRDPRTRGTAWAKLGALELELGQVERAVEHLERARELGPAGTELLNYLGEAYRRQGRTEEARTVWRRSLALDPGQTRLRQYLEREFPASE